MQVTRNMIGWLLAGTAMPAMAAQQPPAPPVAAPAPEPAPTPPPAQPSLQLRTADGQPLPPDVERRLRERLQADPAAAKGGVVISPSAPPGTAAGDPPAPGAPPAMQFRGADGKPLPPEVEARLREHFRTNPLPTAPRPAGNDGEVVVTGERPRGAVLGDLPPERSFSSTDIRAFGAATLGELLETLAPQVSSNRGRGDDGPVTLLNGRRIADFSEIARIPPEAIERMDVFPEELALKYGFRADQKVVNVVTFPRYTTRVGQLAVAAPTEGERATGIVNLDYLALRGDTRLQLGAAYNRSDALLESDRGVRQPAGVVDQGGARTLLPRTERLTLNGLVAGPLPGDIAGSLSGRYEANRAESLLGLDGSTALRRVNDSDSAQVGTTLNGRAGRWQWTLTGNYQRTATDILTDTAAGGARETARSIDAVADADLLLAGPVVELPAGPLSASVRGGVALRDFDSRSARGVSMAAPIDLSRDRGSMQASLDLPLLSPRGEKPSSLGSLSINANAAFERLSDFGTLRAVGYGANWSPFAALSLIASATHEAGAPTLEQLGGPILVTPNVRTFDFSRGEVVDITRVSGGNPGLRADDRHVLRLGANARPFSRTDFTLSLDYVATRIDDPITPFPIATPAIEAAFPDRFVRDGGGRLTRIDGRPLNFERSEQRQLRWGLNFTRPLGPVPPGLQNAKPRVFASEADARRAFPTATFVRAGDNSPMARQADNLRSRLYVSLYHNWYLRDAILTRDGLPELDLLDGDAVAFRGGRRRHEVELQAGVFKRGLGARLTAIWQSGTRARGAGGSADDLRFASLTTVNLNLFANLAERLGGASAPDWAKGARATFGITNLFNTRPRVRDGSGATPLSYQPDYLDPIGRSITLGLRKTF